MENVLEIRHLQKAFGEHVVLRDIDFAAKPGEVVCIIGSSGSGKSTLLPAACPCRRTTRRWAWCSSSSTCSTT